MARLGPQATTTHASCSPTSQPCSSESRMPGRSWTRLTGALCRDLEQALRADLPVSPVLKRHGVSRDSYYDWQRIGRGELEVWPDGTPISFAMRKRCWEFCRRLQRA